MPIQCWKSPAHQKPIIMKMEPSFTMVVPGTEGSRRSLIWASIPTRCTHPELSSYAATFTPQR